MVPTLGNAQSSGSATFAAAQWIEGVFFGSLGTALAVIAVAWVGFELLTGRASLRRMVQVVLGLFILFGAPRIANEIVGLGQARGAASIANDSPPPPFTSPKMPPTYDPYAGAAMPGDGRE